MKHIINLLFLLLYTGSVAQQTDCVDFIHGDVDVSFFPESKSVEGNVTYKLRINKDIDSIIVDAKNLDIKTVILDGKAAIFDYDMNRILLKKEFTANDRHTLLISWSAQPKKALYFIGWNDKAPNQIWTQGQGKYISNWLPSFNDVNEKVEFDMTITFNKAYEVISNGKLIKKEVGEKETVWVYDMMQPMSSYLLAIAIGKYDKNIEYAKSGIPLEMYYYPEELSKVEPTYRYTKEMFDFMEDETGFPFPWQNYKQVPVHDFLYSGMENTSLTIFSDSFITDNIGFIDKNYVNVNAHELAHQWFGNLVTAESGQHHWLQEGFATYYALLAERNLFGDDYYYWQLFEYAQELIRQDKAGKSTSLLNPKSNSITFYKKGAWALHMLREQVGEKDFRKGVKKYLKKHQYNNVETLDFLTEMEEISGQDLTLYASEWLLSKPFNHELAYNSLAENNFAAAMLQMQEFDDKSDVTTLISKYDDVLHADSYYPLQQELFSRIKNVDSPEAIQLYKATLLSNDIKKRQAVALSLKEIPLVLKADYESLLNDKSYVTIESALYNLWNNFPEDQEKYLEQTKNVIGFRDKNIRTLWLVLAILTDNDELGDSNDFLKELNSYTSPNYHFEVRQNAFNYLRWIRSCQEECQENLRNASQHHNWRFKQFVKRMLESH